MGKLSGRLGGSRIVGISVGLFTLLFALGPAWGSGRRSGGNRQSENPASKDRRTQEKAARKACLTGDHKTGVSILADLFVEYEEPIYVFNQGRCLEQNARYKDAIPRFEEFLRIGDDPADRAAAQKHLKDCKSKLPAEDKLDAMAPPPLAQPLPQPLPQPIPQPDATAQIIEKTKAEPEPPKNGRRLLVAGIVTAGVGIGAVIAGVAFNVKANSMVDEMETTVDAYTSSKSSSQKTYETLAWVGYGVGAACIATGTVLTVIGARRRGPSTQLDVALVPAIGPRQAGVLLHGGF